VVSDARKVLICSQLHESNLLEYLPLFIGVAPSANYSFAHFAEGDTLTLNHKKSQILNKSL
jgi:hypothetical protein